MKAVRRMGRSGAFPASSSGKAAESGKDPILRAISVLVGKINVIAPLSSGRGIRKQRGVRKIFNQEP
jgi:hypothetical protein